MQIYLLADIRSVADQSQPLSGDLTVRPIAEADVPALAQMYVRAYDLGAKAIEAAVAEMASAFDGT